MDKNVPNSSRAHIGIFGRRNNGKSSLINILAGQDVAIVSDRPGTTTDPVKKAMEITGLGPVVVIDTAGIDDTGDLGGLRVNRTMDVINQVDCALMVVVNNTVDEYERELVRLFEKKNTPFFVVHNKSDVEPLKGETAALIREQLKTDVIDFSTGDSSNVGALIDLLKKHIPTSLFNNPTILGDLVSYGDVVLLITPIDVQAPRGRLILPQVQTIRDCLDNDCIVVMCKERELEALWKNTGFRPALAVTDSQEFLKAAASVPEDIPLTSFSILFARLKGDFQSYLQGTPHISQLRHGDSVLILESCSHHVAGDDIGRVKIPRWIKNYTGKDVHFDVVAGLDNPPRPVEDYSLLIQCGGCMLTRKQIINRVRPAVEAGVPVTNYGMAIAYCLGIYERALKPFGHKNNTSLAYL
ncbi:MAG TPA: [FeFe] hydrogenase H-cluster maturation GTPase HydF [Spirochaetota bacterium]|nr:[FeFe] hydrogenase H-cluster maturation GTPase HydF [Spirochaetota bacterium]HPI90641.1 [FeFe] hydrogenase H-cluster maturation GTPase HydF [Spirochaetota bacterium]HPR49183.1 [FeFe] hydrogenase H-cluster maturation GTPase HydF [Spirochaetota bacterium]